MPAPINAETINTTRDAYRDILSQSLFQSAFYERIAGMLDLNPYFTPGYVEFLLSTEESHDSYQRRRLQREVFARIREMATNRSLQQTLQQHWTAHERYALTELLRYLKNGAALTQTQQLSLRFYTFLLRGTLGLDGTLPNEEPRHLKLTTSVDLEPLQQEIRSIGRHWWLIDTSRQSSVSHHQDTWCIQIRTLPTRQNEYTPADGVHESVASNIAFRFPNIHAEVLRLATELNIGLARVALVMMKPWSHSYRHYDAEFFLRGRDRYHLVLQCGRHNMVSSGPELVNAKEGEVWFFDNKAMHRTHNGSNIPRIHLIFDGYPLDSL